MLRGAQPLHVTPESFLWRQPTDRDGGAVPGLLTTYGPQRSQCSFAISSASSRWPRLRYLAYAC